MSRIDYYRDLNAPKANSVVPSVTAVVCDDAGRVLLIHKTDNDLWALPGGGHDIGESVGDTVVREVMEETGIAVDIDNIVGLYTDPQHVMAYDDGEVRQQFSICFRAHPTGGSLQTSSESRRSAGSIQRTSMASTFTRRCGCALSMAWTAHARSRTSAESADHA